MHRSPLFLLLLPMNILAPNESWAGSNAPEFLTARQLPSDAKVHPPERWSAIARWLDRLRALPGWRGIYDLLPRADAEVP